MTFRTFHACQLTAKDFTYLQSLLASKDHDKAYLDLLREKLGSATLLLDHTIDHRIATIESLVAFSVDGKLMEQHILARDGHAPPQGIALPITTLSGLALLGLREGEAFPLMKPNCTTESLRLIKVAYQPEAARRTNATTVVAFQPRWMQSVTGAGTRRSDPFNDDPGPGAA
jgi:regulator of nucleoside diphosphate kinase